MKLENGNRNFGKYRIDPKTHICKCGKKIVKYHAKQCLECYRKEVTKPKIFCKCGVIITKRAKTGMCNKCYCASREDYRKAKPISQYDLSGNFIKQWNSIYQVVKETFNDSFPMEQQPIVKVARGKRKTAYNFIWKYVQN